MTSSFGARLRHLRQQAGLSQVELAGDDLSPSYVSLLEADKRAPSTEVLAQLAARLGCSVGQLIDGRPSDRDQRVALELAYARLAIEHGESADARGRLTNLLAEDDLAPQARDEAAFQLARASERLGDHEAAVTALLALHERARAGSARIPLIDISLFLCHCYRAAGDLNQATMIGEQALEVARAQGLGSTDDYFQLAATVMHAYTELGDFLHARATGQRLIEEAEAVGRPAGQAALYWNAAVLAEYEGRLSDAVHFSERALVRMGELESTRDFARLRLAVAGILMGCDPPDSQQAGALLTRCFDDLKDLGSRVDLAEWAYVQSAVLLHAGDVLGAEAQARESVTLLAGQTGIERARALLALSDALAAQGQAAEAREALAHVQDELQSVGRGRATGLLWRELAERAADLGDADAATSAFRRALDEGGLRDRSRVSRQVVRERMHTPVAVAGPRQPSAPSGGPGAVLSP